MNLNKLLQLIFYPLLLTLMVGFLLAIITTYHLPVMIFWVTLAIGAAIMCAVMLGENTTNQKEEEQ